MAQIKAYTFTPRAIEAYDGWNSETKTLTPMEFGHDLHEVLDNLTQAAEAGVLDNFLWPQQLFADKISYGWFIHELENYDESFRITDEWWTALASLIDNCDEEEFVTAREIANKLTEYVETYEMLENFERDTPAYKYSLEEVNKACFEECKNSFSHGAYAKTMSHVAFSLIQSISEWAKFYDFKLSADDIYTARAEGLALRVSDKATQTKKVAAKKTVTKKAKV